MVVDARDANAAAKHNLLAPQARAAALARLALFPLLRRRGLALELPALELRVLEGEILFARFTSPECGGLGRMSTSLQPSAG